MCLQTFAGYCMIKTLSSQLRDQVSLTQLILIYLALFNHNNLSRPLLCITCFLILLIGFDRRLPGNSLLGLKFPFIVFETWLSFYRKSVTLYVKVVLNGATFYYSFETCFFCQLKFIHDHTFQNLC